MHACMQPGRQASKHAVAAATATAALRPVNFLSLALGPAACLLACLLAIFRKRMHARTRTREPMYQRARVCAFPIIISSSSGVVVVVVSDG